MTKRLLAFAGVLVPLVYAGAVIAGGALWHGYSHVAQPVSDLIATGAPNKSLLDPLFAAYNLLTLAFAVGLLLVVRASTGNPRRTVGTVAAYSLIAEGVFGFATLFFPEGAPGAPITATGTMHITLAALSSLTTMLTILLMGFWFRKAEGLQGYGLYSFVSVGVVFVSGGSAAASVATHSPVGGLLERITIGAFLVWVFLVALKLYASQAGDAEGTRALT